MESNGWVAVELYIVNGVVVENHSATLDRSNDLAMVGSQAREMELERRPPGQGTKLKSRTSSFIWLWLEGTKSALISTNFRVYLIL